MFFSPAKTSKTSFALKLALYTFFCTHFLIPIFSISMLTFYEKIDSTGLVLGAHYSKCRSLKEVREFKHGKEAYLNQPFILSIAPSKTDSCGLASSIPKDSWS